MTIVDRTTRQPYDPRDPYDSHGLQPGISDMQTLPCLQGSSITEVFAAVIDDIQTLPCLIGRKKKKNKNVTAGQDMSYCHIFCLLFHLVRRPSRRDSRHTEAAVLVPCVVFYRSSCHGPLRRLLQRRLSWAAASFSAGTEVLGRCVVFFYRSAVSSASEGTIRSGWYGYCFKSSICVSPVRTMTDSAWVPLAIAISV